MEAAANDSDHDCIGTSGVGLAISRGRLRRVDIARLYGVNRRTVHFGAGAASVFGYRRREANRPASGDGVP